VTRATKLITNLVMARSDEKLNERRYPSMPLAGFEPEVKLIDIRQDTN
jgi:hypothetical protein